MARKSQGRTPSRVAATTSGYFSGLSPIGQNQIDEGFSQPSSGIMESAPGQMSSGNRLNPATPTPDIAPGPGEAGMRTAPSEVGLRDFADQTGRASGMLGTVSTLGALAGDRDIASLGKLAGPLGIASQMAGMVDSVNKGKFGEAALGVIGAVGGPIGSLVNQGISYGMGYNNQVGAPDNMGGRMGSAMGAGHSLSDAIGYGLQNSALGKFGGMTGYDLGTPGVSITSPVRGMTAETTALGPLSGSYGSGGWSNAGYQGNGVTSSPVRSGSTQTTSLGTLSSGGGSYGSASSGGFGGSSSASSSYGGRSGGYGSSYGSGSVGGFADGGMVGLTGPTYADGGAMSSSPASLAQMGFANGGSVGMQAPGAPMQQDPTAVIARMTRDPMVQQKVRQLVGPAMQSGQLTSEELVTLGRIAEASLHNPQLYPQLRKFALENGLTPLPPSYDQRIASMLIVASKVMGSTPAGQIPPTDVAQMENPTGMANGGMLRGPGTGRSDSIGTVNESDGSPVKVANGEYVIPKHVVDAKGKEFFDKMLRQYAQLTPQGA